ncbi:carboxypeptidase-like regulatory domain-containing protein [Edaphobacter albus]|uniref:carboxypeptidase-like regulatory domain-containing protein n=1 Tax=Edaphobacter sp. 4G125 TaxID=2763071 RepID=UPI0016456A74|nr:carboxypeptidase-like regulatory domain-containing protein [Edaphobacter sp. 4G125]QNI35464.1 carboxypeptidase regulatory-like domain-containing protein [Edaphobacter sp. 4G125]
MLIGNTLKLRAAFPLLVVAFAGICPVAAMQMGSGAALTSPSSGPITVSGVVVNATNGIPISRALVRINDRAMLTDHLGRFEFTQFTPPSSAVLEVQKPGYYFGQETGSSMPLRADQMAQPVVARLYPEALITGTLTTQDGTPLPQIFVSALRRSYNDSGSQWLPVKNSMTNSHGEFRLAVPPGDYRITSTPFARLRGNSQMALPISYPSPGVSETADSLHMSSGTEQRLELHATVSPSHTVKVMLDTSPERGFPMLLARSSNGAVFPVNVTRGGGPEGMQIGLPSGTFTLLATLNRRDGVEYGEATVTVGEDNNSEVALHLAPVAPIPIQVVVDGDTTSDKTPPGPQQLGLWMENVQRAAYPTGSTFSMPVMNGNQGAVFRLTPGTYRFNARNSGSWYVKSITCGTSNLLQQDLTVSAGGAGSVPIIVTVSNQTGGLQGLVRQKGSPVSGWVYAVPSGQSAVPVYSIHSGTDGSFNLSSLPPGSYDVVAFESRHSADYRAPNALAQFNTYVRQVTITSGNKAMLDLESVPDTELHP